METVSIISKIAKMAKLKKDFVVKFPFLSTEAFCFPIIHTPITVSSKTNQFCLTKGGIPLTVALMKSIAVTLLQIIFLIIFAVKFGKAI
jgi:hypothetical protein